MREFLSIVGLIGLGIAVGAATVMFVLGRRFFGRGRGTGTATLISGLVKKHFAPLSLDDLTISERQFPHRVRADLQKAVSKLFGSGVVISHFCGVRKEYSHESLTLGGCIVDNEHSPSVSVPPQYEDVDVGEAEPVRCLKNGLWFLEQDGEKFVVLLSQHMQYGEEAGLMFQVGAPNSPVGTKITDQFFKHLEESVLKAESYRGKILSLETGRRSYSGQSTGIKVHALRTVEREQVILPRATLELLERNVIQFVAQRPHLKAFGQAVKKGILFYGPPGTGKTHTIHYLAKALPGHTTLLITAEQVGLLTEYMTLARLLQPSIVVMEDVDLVGRDREEMGVCEEIVLNKLLNEMDGLTEEADILFLLTTNRPEALERALASRPGRVDQAIEFPLPDAEGRAKLARLYSYGIGVSEELVQAIVRRTENVSAAFIKELMRRSVQFHLERNGTNELDLASVEGAVQEMLFRGGSLNLKLLGATGAEAAAEMS